MYCVVKIFSSKAYFFCEENDMEQLNSFSKITAAGLLYSVPLAICRKIVWEYWLR